MNVFVLHVYGLVKQLQNGSNITAIEHLTEEIYFHCFANCTTSCVHKGVNENVLT